MLRGLGIVLMSLVLIGLQGGVEAHKAKQGQDDQKSAAPVANTQVKKIETPAPQPKPEQHIQADVRIINPPAKDGYDKAAFWISVILAGVGIAGVGVGICTLLFLRSQTIHIRRQADMAQRQARLISTQAHQMEQQTEILRDSVAVAQKAADSAKVQATAAMGIALPTLMLSEFAFTPKTQMTAYHFFQRPSVKIVLKNFGQSPAFLKAWYFSFVWDELPDKPVYDFPYPCGVEEVIEPGKTYTLDPETTEAAGPTPDGVIDAVIAGEKHLTVYGFVSYGDIFGSPIRYMKFSKRLYDFDLARNFMEVMDYGGYEYTGQHEHYDAPNQKWPKPN